MGNPASTLSVGAEGPSPRPSSPWHLLQGIESSENPRPSLSADGSVPPPGALENLSDATCWLVSAKNEENVLMYAATSRRSPSDRRPFHAGIALPGSPSSIARIRSASVGSCPEAVLRIL